MVRDKLVTAWHISLEEFYRWLRNSRLLILGVMLVFIHVQIIEPLKGCAQLMGEKLSYAEPFEALCNSGAICLAVPLLFLAMMADFPQKDGIDLFFQVRCSKKVWIFGQALFAFEASLFFVVFLAAASAVMLTGSGEWRMEFSHAITHYAAYFPEHSQDYVVRLLPESIYQQMTLQTAFCNTFILMLLMFFLLSMVLLFSALCSKKYIGIVVDIFFVVLGTATTALRLDAMWLFPMAHTLPEVHYEKYLSEMIFPMGLSYLYLAGAGTALFCGCMLIAKKYQAGKG